MRIVYLLALLVFLCGCATTLSRGVKSNNDSLSRISIGMPKEQVMQIMGTTPIESEGKTIDNPYRTDILQGSTQTYQVFYYVTNMFNDDGMISDNELTPFVFFDGKLIGTGWDFMQTIR